MDNHGFPIKIVQVMKNLDHFKHEMKIIICVIKSLVDL